MKHFRSVLFFTLLFLVDAVSAAVPDQPSQVRQFIDASWKCLESDPISRSTHPDDEFVKKQVTLILERMERHLKVVDLLEVKLPQTKQTETRAFRLKVALSSLAEIESSGAELVRHSKSRLRCLDTESSRELYQRFCAEVKSRREKLQSQGEADGEPGATDNPDDAQRLREDH